MTTTTLERQLTEAASGIVTLEDRLLRIQDSIDKMKPTGLDQYKNTTISIADVEEQIGPALKAARVLTEWSMTDLVNAGFSSEKIDPKTGEVTRGGTLWQVKLHIRLVNADDDHDFIEGEWQDVGGSPSAAASFAIKRYYKALFHIVEDDEQTAHQTAHQTASKPARQLAPPNVDYETGENNGDIPSDPMTEKQSKMVYVLSKKLEDAGVEFRRPNRPLSKREASDYIEYLDGEKQKAGID